MGHLTLLLESGPGGEAGAMADRLVHRRLLGEYADHGRAHAAAQAVIERVLPQVRRFVVAEGEIPCGYVLLVPEGDDAVVFDLSLDDAAHGPEVRALVEDLARREGAQRLLAAYSPGDLVQTGFVTGGGFTVLATQMRLDLDHRLPTDDRVAVGPMTEAEYGGWVDGRTADYVAQRIAAGEPADVAEQTGREQMATLLPDGLASADTHLLVGRHGEQVVGTLWLSTARPMVYVYDVEVREELRGQGYGAALMRATAQWAHDRGAHAVGLNVFGHNTVARGLYDRLGYHVVEDFLAKPLAP